MVGRNEEESLLATLRVNNIFRHGSRLEVNSLHLSWPPISTKTMRRAVVKNKVTLDGVDCPVIRFVFSIGHTSYYMIFFIEYAKET